MAFKRARWGATVLPLLLAGSLGCGESTTAPLPPDPGGTGAGESTGGAAGGTNWDVPTETTTGTGGAGEAPLLADGVAGTECADASACGPMGTCAQELTGGNIAQMIGLPPVAAPGGYCSASCENNAACGAGSVCFGTIDIGIDLGGVVLGECRKSCASPADCREGHECATVNSSAGGGALGMLGGALPSTCQPIPQVTPIADGVVGSACASDADCPGGACGMNGVCSGACVQDTDCGTGGVCIAGAYGSAGTCAKSCAADTDCPADGWGCLDGMCGPKLPDNIAGSPCTAATAAMDCAGGMCREEAFMTVYPGGYCVTGPCTTDASCGAGGVCINQMTCMQACATEADCREGYACMAHPLVMGGPTICYPAGAGGPGGTTGGATGGMPGGATAGTDLDGGATGMATGGVTDATGGATAGTTDATGGATAGTTDATGGATAGTTDATGGATAGTTSGGATAGATGEETDATTAP